MRKKIEIPSIYISYAWSFESDKIADSIEREFSANGVKIIRDKKTLKYKGRIKSFMEDIGLGKYVVLVISNDYLRSENCMFELLQIFKNKNFYERIFPVVLDDVKIAKATDRLELVKYWENESKLLDDKIRGLKELSNIQGVTDDLNLYTEIRNNIAELTNILKDINSLNTEKHINSDFKQLFELIQKNISNDLLINKKHYSFNLILGAVLSVLILPLIILFFLEKKTPPITEDIIETPIVQVDTIKEKKAKPKPDIIPIADARKAYYVVTIIVPQIMSNEKVFVDGKEAQILYTSDVSITLRLVKKDGSYHFEINKKNKKCTADQLIDKDSIKFTMRCDF